MSISALNIAILSNNPAAKISFDHFYKSHNSWLTGWLNKRLHCSYDAEDLAQDTFVRVMDSSVKVEELREQHNYLLTIARGLTIDLFRKRTLERQYYEALTHLPEQEYPSAEQHAIILQTLMDVDAMFAGLPKKVRQAFILSKLEGLSYPDIATKMGISLRSVNNYLAQAIEHCCLFQLRQQD
jgi:RNA polymerase sigma-70 factor (ECF subfamily)